jgi:hypothetical protein
LRNLILKCEKPEEFQYILGGVDLYRSRAQDFTEEICTHFIKKAVSLGHPVSAAKVLSRTDHSLGAWVHRNSSLTIFESLAATGETELLIELITSLSKRGVLFEPKVAANILLSSASTKGDSEMYEKASDLCKKLVSDTELTSLRQQHQAPTTSAASEQVEGSKE